MATAPTSVARGLPGAVLTGLLVACGPTGAAPSPNAGAEGSAAPTASSTSSANATPTTASSPSRSDASGASFGVDQTQWPRSLTQSRTLLKRLPEQVAGEGRTLEIGAKYDAAFAIYGQAGEVFVQNVDGQEVVEGQEKPMRPDELLSAGFGLGSTCAQGTFAGTVAGVPVASDAPEDSFSTSPPGVRAGAEPQWFSCRLAEKAVEDEPQPEKWRHALGWTSGRTAWMLYARDEEATASLVAALREAAD